MVLTYNDKEVECFHPICWKSLRIALKKLGKERFYDVEHHKMVGKLEMDFAIVIRQTHKTACVIEVKRTPSAVKSSRYQCQAMSYVQQMPAALVEQPYYVLTNIEWSCLFKYDAVKPNVQQQLIKPGLTLNKAFAEAVTEAELVQRTADHYAALIDKALGDKGEYDLSLDDIITSLSPYTADLPSWNSQFARIAYEYVRGAFNAVGRKNGLKDIRQYDQRIEPMSKAFGEIDFKGIFNLGTYAELPKVGTSILKGAYILGKDCVDADEMVTTMHQIISTGKEMEGEVPTDIELARLMAKVAQYYCPHINGAVCDPAAGSGNLLSCIGESYMGIKPSQIKANDKNPLLLQLLSLRLGLKFPAMVCPNESPCVTACDICDLPADYFSDIDLVLVNPPMVSAVADTKQRQKIYKRMESIGCEPATNKGQSTLEAAFLELVNALAKKGTVTVALLPKTHLTSLGDAAVSLRRFLLRDFGITLIFNYPGKGLFEMVAKDTVMVVGRKGAVPETITELNSLDAVEDIDLNVIPRILDNNGKTEECGVECIMKTRREMEESIADGWIANDLAAIETINYVNQYFEPCSKMTQLKSLSGKIRRGKVGNKGLSDLLYISSCDELFTILTDEEKRNLAAGMKNAKTDTMEIDSGDNLFFNVNHFSESRISCLVERYIGIGLKKGKQARKAKTVEEIMAILKNESSHSCSANSILLPRDLRRYGRVYRCSQQTFPSTNFFIISGLDETASKLLASWMTTVFFQLSCERYGKNQEGTRKMESGGLMRTYIPNLSLLSPSESEKVLSVSSNIAFLDLCHPEVRRIDHEWAKVMFGEQANEPTMMALDLLTRKAIGRNK